MKGAAMGVAETIPGVSGGTLAFITGIYEKLIDTIKAFHPSLITLFRKEGFGAVWEKINGNFLVFLLSGMVVGFGFGVVVVEYLLEHYPPTVWAFFLGLIIASIIYVGKQIKNWNISTIAMFIVGAVVAFGITQMPIAQSNDSLWFVFICASLAVSALILPGISGSFILLILGMYQFILHDTLKDGVLVQRDPHSMLIIAVFILGMIFGLATISRIISWALHKYHNQTLALLAGFMLGALNKLWPWRVPTKILSEEGHVVDFAKGMEIDHVIKEVGVLPSKYAAELGEPTFFVVSIVTLVAGLVLVLYLDSATKVEL